MGPIPVEGSSGRIRFLCASAPLAGLEGSGVEGLNGNVSQVRNALALPPAVVVRRVLGSAMRSMRRGDPSSLDSQTGLGRSLRNSPDGRGTSPARMSYHAGRAWDSSACPSCSIHH